ncbi:MAG: glutathione S-transferase family protein [Pseudomonadota bacterium]
MPVYDSKSQFAQELVGVHLFHYALSNCSQRCRLMLELKEIDWSSHHIDLPQKQHLDPAYTDINPHALVPSLVHDGVVILESNDIIAYIESEFPGQRLTPEDDSEQLVSDKLIELSSSVQGSIKTLSHEYLFKARRQQITHADIDDMIALGKNTDVTDFLRDYVHDGLEWRRRLALAEYEIETTLDCLEARLAHTSGFLSGPQYGLADVSWSVNYYRLHQCGYEMLGSPKVSEWGMRIISIPAFYRAVIDYRP